jgi:hypothetical protein
MDPREYYWQATIEKPLVNPARKDEDAHGQIVRSS